MASDALLKSYPLSKVCLDILGKRLLQDLEFGFFDPDFQIIRQGERGKDLFLLCNHIADVVVFDKVIVQMEAPVLFGDKAIIDRHATRNATIRIADEGQALVLKIPMGLFLRDFKLGKIEDDSFKQERKIYYNLFLEIQNRLFKYSEVQKQLWDEVNKQLKLLNIQLISNSLNKKEENTWEPKVWQVVIQYLKAVHGFPWPNNVSYTTKTLVNILTTILDKRFPRKSYRGSDQAFAYQKQTIWRRWLETLSELLVKVLPNNQLPINLGDVELFNPGIYQMRMHTLLVSIQRNFMFKKVLPHEEKYEADKLKAQNFFSKDKDKNEFDLSSYLKTLSEMFVLKNPNRVLAQVAQQTAQLSAACENEFNESVSKMKHLLEKVKKLSKTKQEVTDEQLEAKKALDQRIAIINQGFKSYNSRIVGHTYTYAGVIRFAEGKVPMIGDIIKASASEPLKRNLTKAFRQIISQMNLEPVGFTEKGLQELFYLCQGNFEDIIPETQLTTHYWIPISEGISLQKGDKDFGPVKPGTLIGGNAWHQAIEEGSEEQKDEWILKMPKKIPEQPLDDLCLVMVIPKKRIPWIINSEPMPDQFESEYLPLLQWMIFKNLESISIISELRDTFIKKYSQVVEVVVVEKKVREFESNENRLQQTKYSRILKLVYDILGIALEKQASMSSEKLSRQVYNEIIKQTKRDFSKLNPEEQGNKAYTLWRFVQSEIVSKVFADELEENIKLPPPKSVFLSIKCEIESLLAELHIEIPEGAYELTRESGVIHLDKLTKTDKTALTNEALDLALQISNIVEQNLTTLVDEANSNLARLKQISSIQTEFNVNDIQSRFILDAIAKLRHLLQTKISSEGNVPAQVPV